MHASGLFPWVIGSIDYTSVGFTKQLCGTPMFCLFGKFGLLKVKQVIET